MGVALHRSLAWTVLAGALACGPSVGDDGSDARGDASSSSSGESSGAPLTASSGAEDTTGGTTEASSGTTGPSPEPVGCFTDPNMEETECCPQLPKPCPEVRQECPDIACEGDPFSVPVTNPMAAQCMLAALAEGGVAVYDRVAPYGFGTSHEQWLVEASRDVTLLSWAIQDFGFGYGYERCRLVDAEVLTACAAESDPQALSDCLAGALEGCEEVTDPVCPQ